MDVDQSSLGISYRLGEKFQASVEGFYKKYHHVPFSVADSIPLVCKGNDYGVIGNELLSSIAEGRSYGLEILLKGSLRVNSTWLLPSRCLKANTVMGKTTGT